MGSFTGSHDMLVFIFSSKSRIEIESHHFRMKNFSNVVAGSDSIFQRTHQICIAELILKHQMCDVHAKWYWTFQDSIELIRWPLNKKSIAVTQLSQNYLQPKICIGFKSNEFPKALLYYEISCEKKWCENGSSTKKQQKKEKKKEKPIEILLFMCNANVRDVDYQNVNKLRDYCMHTIA